MIRSSSESKWIGCEELLFDDPPERLNLSIGLKTTGFCIYTNAIPIKSIATR